MNFKWIKFFLLKKKRRGDESRYEPVVCIFFLKTLQSRVIKKQGIKKFRNYSNLFFQR